MFSLFKQALDANGLGAGGPQLPPAVPQIKQPGQTGHIAANNVQAPSTWQQTKDFFRANNPIDVAVKNPYKYWTDWNPADTGWKGRLARNTPYLGANARLDRNAAGLLQYGDDGKMKFDFNFDKIKKWIGSNSGTLKTLLPYGAGLLGVGMLSNAIRNQPGTQVNVSYPSAIAGMPQQPRGLFNRSVQGTLFPNEQ